MKNKISSEYKPAFIVSTGRCGSTMLAYVLAINPSLFVLNSPAPQLRTAAFIRWKSPERAIFVERQIIRKREKYIRRIHRNRVMYVESSVAAGLLIGELSKIFDAKFIHIYRNVRDFVKSGIARAWYKPESLPLNMKTWLRRQFLIDVGRSTTDLLLTPPSSMKGQIEKIAWRWAEVNRIILDQFRLLPAEKKFSIRLEEFGRNTLDELQQFLGAPVDDSVLDEMMAIADKKPNRTKSFGAQSRAEWTQMEDRRIDEISADVMQMLGYAEK